MMTKAEEARRRMGGKIFFDVERQEYYRVVDVAVDRANYNECFIVVYVLLVATVDSVVSLVDSRGEPVDYDECLAFEEQRNAHCERYDLESFDEDTGTIPNGEDMRKPDRFPGDVDCEDNYDGYTIHIYIYTYIHIYISAHMRMYACAYIHTYIHTYTQTYVTAHMYAATMDES